WVRIAPASIRTRPPLAGAVQRVVHAAADLRGQAGYGFELVASRVREGVGRREPLHEQPPPGRADAGQAVEDRVDARAAAALPVAPEREAVGLIAQPPHETHRP